MPDRPPSTVDLPAAGCWHLWLAWSGRSDAMDLGYRAAGWGRGRRRVRAPAAGHGPVRSG
ncbi:hypothetical protein [Micromonospora sp. NPDC049240]|uniref:hypothetical protein n=1 Tax=Micromonospora sp. NPDC049240 TaxID=3155151 RepID=UPI0033DA0310